MTTGFQRFAFALGGTVALFGSAFWLPNDTVAAIAAIVAIFLGLPLSLLLYRDAVRTRVEQNPARSPRSLVVLALPIRLLGLVSLTIGVAIVAWVVYNLLVARQSEFTGVLSPLQLVVPILLIGFGWRCLRAPLSRSLPERNSE